MEAQRENTLPGAGIRMLIADGDPDIYDNLIDSAQREGFEVLIVKNGLEALEVFRRFQPDIILLATGMDGFQLCREIRKISAVPILFLSVEEKVEERIRGLEIGADDYITKPFCGREVMARVRAVLRRTKSDQQPDKRETICVDNLTVNIGNYTVFVGEEKLNMTRKEVETMWLLAGNPERAFTREEILEYLWGEDYFDGGRSLDSHMKRMRSKFKDVEHAGWDIKTIWGLGYKFILHDRQ